MPARSRRKRDALWRQDTIVRDFPGIDEAGERARGPNGKRMLPVVLLCSLAHCRELGE